MLTSMKRAAERVKAADRENGAAAKPAAVAPAASTVFMAVRNDDVYLSFSELLYLCLSIFLDFSLYLCISLSFTLSHPLLSP